MAKGADLGDAAADDADVTDTLAVLIDHRAGFENGIKCLSHRSSAATSGTGPHGPCSPYPSVLPCQVISRTCVSTRSSRASAYEGSVSSRPGDSQGQRRGCAQLSQRPDHDRYVAP